MVISNLYAYNYLSICYARVHPLHKMGQNRVLCRGEEQGRRKPNVGPRSAQILRVSGFVNSKKDGENASVLSGFSCDFPLQKKGLQGKMPPFSQDFGVISEKKKSSRKNATVFSKISCDLKKKVFGLPHTDFSLSFRWVL